MIWNQLQTKCNYVIKKLRSLENLPVLFLWGPIRIFIVLTNWKKTGICLTNTNVWSVYFPKIFPSVAATCKHPCSTCGHTSSWMLCLTVRNNHFHNTNKFWHRPSLCKLSDQKTKGTSVKLSRCSAESVSVLYPRLKINPVWDTWKEVCSFWAVLLLIIINRLVYD